MLYAALRHVAEVLIFVPGFYRFVLDGSGQISGKLHSMSGRRIFFCPRLVTCFLCGREGGFYFPRRVMDGLALSICERDVTGLRRD